MEQITSNSEKSYKFKCHLSYLLQIITMNWDLLVFFLLTNIFFRKYKDASIIFFFGNKNTGNVTVTKVITSLCDHDF